MYTADDSHLEGWRQDQVIHRQLSCNNINTLHYVTNNVTPGVRTSSSDTDTADWNALTVLSLYTSIQVVQACVVVSVSTGRCVGDDISATFVSE